MASRGYFKQLETFCEHLGIPSVRIEPPPEALAILDAVVADHVSRVAQHGSDDFELEPRERPPHRRAPSRRQRDYVFTKKRVMTIRPPPSQRPCRS